MELSIVPVPANVNAVAIMRGAKIDEKLCAIVEKSMKSGRRLSAASLASLHTIRGKLDECNRILDEAREEYTILVGDLDQDMQDEMPQEAAPKGNKPDAKNDEGIIEIVDTHLYEFDEPKNGKII